MKVRRSWRWYASGLLLGVLATALLVALLSQTGWGQRRVLRVTLGAVGGNVNGTLTVGRIAGNLLSGARLYDVSIIGDDGAPFLRVDSAYAEYNLPTLLGTQLEIERLVLFDPEVYLWKFPGDTLWNYQRIFSDTASTDTVSERTTTIDRLTVVDGFVRVVLAWEPEDTTPGPARRAEIREALADSSPILVRRVPGGFVRSYRFTDLDASLSELFFPAEIGRGSYLRADRLSTNAYIYRDSLEIRHLEGELAVHDSTVELRAPTVRLPNSRLAMAGTVLITENVPLDVVFRGDRISLGDFRWLYPRLPEDGRGEMLLRWETRPDGDPLFLFPRLDVVLPGTRLRGSFGVVLGDTLRFTDVALEADPLRVETVEQLLPEDLPVRGLRIGGVTIRGTDP